MLWAWRLIVPMIALMGVVLWSCVGDDPVQGTTATPDASTLDAATSDAATPDARAAEACGDGLKSSDEACEGADLGGATCASSVAMGWIGDVACTPACGIDTSRCTTPPTTYEAIATAASWTTFNVATLNASARGFRGAAFDGRYLYLVPFFNGSVYHGIVARYDTKGDFAADGGAALWKTFDVGSVNIGAKGFYGAAFDGRYLYLVPFRNAAHHGIVARYDTQGDFGTAASWTTFDVASVNPSAKGFAGAAFDGRYLYLVPYDNDGTFDGHIVARYDTQGGFGASTSWTTFDVATVNTSAKGFAGAAFDGRYLYLVPTNNGTSGIVARYDTQVPFGASASWTTFNVASVNAGAKGFQGAAFDGRYLYLAPYFNGASHGIVARYDTRGDFGTPGSWTTFDVASVNPNAKGFQGAAFDGRYLYLVPYSSASGLLARYDTQGDFGTSASWETFDVANVSAGAKGFIGAAFDGRYLYLVPYFYSPNTYNGIVARFDAKTPAWLARRWNASFL